MYGIQDEKYEDEFIFLRRREDGKWFFFTSVKQYYVKGIDMMGHVSPWIRIKSKFYKPEELTVKTLKDDNDIYINKS